MATEKASFPTRRAAAERNREAILAAARAAFAEGDTGISMAEVARRARLGMATLYRNFPGRRELLEALYAKEVEEICRAAVRNGDQSPGEAVLGWLRLQFEFIPQKRLIVSELLEHTAQDGVPSLRSRAIEAGRPLLLAAQRAQEIRDDLTLEQIFDMIVAVAKIPGPPDYLEPIIEATLSGLRAGPRSGRRVG